MAMNETETLATVGRLVEPLVTKAGMTPKEVVHVGSALVVAAIEIFKAVGGNEFAATQLYAAADRCASAGS